ncbi:hypothetical protein VDG1235_3018 [Verrucomicrobiia bacterium DG1235]|nr:hypothetical protein VDG1235_3018 [Verrucomicrobiae bacterium DG1235]
MFFVSVLIKACQLWLDRAARLALLMGSSVIGSGLVLDGR